MEDIVLSGINIIDGGALTIYKQILTELIKLKYDKNRKITAFVHEKKLFEEFEKNINIIEIPKSKKRWLYRIYYEYFYFKKYSKKNNVDIWISLHDMTPNVKAKKRYVYCHNPFPFYKAKMKDGYKPYLFSKFYKYLYKINIKKNTGVIVQQQWMRDAFKKMYHLNNIIVARPNQKVNYYTPKEESNNNEKFTFIFAGFPRPFKNFEVICKASDILKNQNINNFEVLLTIDGKENIYSKRLVKKYGHIENVKFIGLQKQKNLFEIYNRSNCLIFPSKIETWGLPVTEYKLTNKPIILADEPYTHETIGKYDKVVFFKSDDEKQLSEIMLKEINKENTYVKTEEMELEQPYAKNWEELLKMIIM